MKQKARMRAEEIEKQRPTASERTSEPERPTRHESSVHEAAQYASGGGRPTATTLRALQRTVGNAQVQRTLDSQKEEGDQAYPGLAEELARERGSGQPLGEHIQQRMERAFGDDHDFSGVRVHTDSKADALNRHLHSRAFTAGSDIFFREGEFAPETDAGQKLLAHELTHAVQQSHGAVESASSGDEVIVGAPGDAFEQAADRVAEAVTSGSTLAPSHASPSVQRQVEPEEEEEEEEIQNGEEEYEKEEKEKEEEE